MLKKLLAAALSAVLLLAAVPAPALAGHDVGGEVAETHQVDGVAGDVVTEKRVESSLLPLALVTAPLIFVPGGGAAGAAAKKTALWSARTAAGGTMVFAYAADGRKALWKNWPSGRLVFDNAEPSGWLTKYVKDAGINIINWLANTVFSATKSLTEIGINILILAFSLEWTAEAAYWVGDAVKSLLDFGQKDSFARIALLLGVCGLAVAVIARVLRAHLVQAGTAVLLAACVVAALMVYGSMCGQIVQGVTRFTDGLAGAAMGTLTRVFALGDERTSDIGDPLDRGLISMGNAVWAATVLYPWAHGQFGTVSGDELRMTVKQWEKFEGALDDTKKTDRTVAVPWGNGTVTCRFLGKNSLEQMAQKGELSIDTLYLAVGADDAARGELLNVLADREVSGDRFAALCAGTSVNAARHVYVAFLTLFPAIAFLVLAVVLGGSMLVCQIASVLMLIFLPLVGLAALVPDTGWNLAVGFLKRLAGFLFVKVVYGLYLGAVLSFATLLVKGMLSP